jgi:hypothetical protein
MLTDQDLPEGHMLRGCAYHITLIGLIVTAWESTEHQAMLILEWFLGDHHRARAVFNTAFGNNVRCFLLKELADQAYGRDRQEIADLRKLLDRWGNMATDRNNIIHGEWVRDANTNELFRAAAAKDMIDWADQNFRNKKCYTIPEMEQTFQNMLKLAMDMSAFIFPRLQQQFDRRHKYLSRESLP